MREVLYLGKMMQYIILKHLLWKQNLLINIKAINNIYFHNIFHV